MEFSQATTQIQNTRKTYLFKVMFILTLLAILCIFLILIYILPYYANVFWKDFFLNNLSFLYSKDTLVQLIISIFIPIGLVLIFTIISLVISYKHNSRYQDEYMSIIYDELDLNSIKLVSKRSVDQSADIEFINKTLNLKNVEKEHIFTLKSLFEMSFFQFYNVFHKRKDYSLLICTKIENRINGYVQMRFNTGYTIDEYNGKGIYQYNLSDTRKYSSDIYVNSTLGKDTYKIVDDNVVQTMLQLKKFTSVNIVVTITENLFYLWIPGWELKLTDSLFKKLSYNEMDKKVELFTELIDEITDLYIYLVNKEDLWEKKW